MVRLTPRSSATFTRAITRVSPRRDRIAIYARVSAPKRETTLFAASNNTRTVMDKLLVKQR